MDLLAAGARPRGATTILLAEVLRRAKHPQDNALRNTNLLEELQGRRQALLRANGKTLVDVPGGCQIRTCIILALFSHVFPQ
jgi:hypothetical protein